MRANYLIAVCDILGFSDLVCDNELDDVVTHSIGWFRKSLNHSLHKANFPTEVPPTSDLDRHSKVGVAWFSDTVLFYTKNDTDEAIQELLATVAWLIFETLQEGRTKVRGGLAYGEAYIDPLNSMYVGRPIVEAYELEKIQQWSGAALSPSAVNRLPEMARSGQYVDWWVKPYDVPLKNRETLQTLAIDWNLNIHPLSWRMQWSKDQELPTETDLETKRSVCEKFINTKKFHELYCHDCKKQIRDT